MCSWDVGSLPKDVGMGLNGGRVNRGVHGLGPGVEEVAVPGVRLCLLQVWVVPFVSLSCSWGLRMEHGPASVPAALPYYVAFSQLLGLTVVAVTGAWLGLYRGGIAWESSLQFNVHPLCMVIGMIFLQGDGESCGASSLSHSSVPQFVAVFGRGCVQGSCHPRHSFHLDKLMILDKADEEARESPGGLWLEGDTCFPLVALVASGFSRRHLRGYSCLLDRAGPGWVMSYLQGQLEVGKRSRHTCICILFSVDMAELEGLSLG